MKFYSEGRKKLFDSDELMYFIDFEFHSNISVDPEPSYDQFLYHVKSYEQSKLDYKSMSDPLYDPSYFFIGKESRLVEFCNYIYWYVIIKSGRKLPPVIRYEYKPYYHSITRNLADRRSSYKKSPYIFGDEIVMIVNKYFPDRKIDVIDYSDLTKVGDRDVLKRFVDLHDIPDDKEIELTVIDIPSKGEDYISGMNYTCDDNVYVLESLSVWDKDDNRSFSNKQPKHIIDYFNWSDVEPIKKILDSGNEDCLDEIIFSKLEEFETRILSDEY